MSATYDVKQVLLRSEPPGYGKALDDFGVMALLEKLSAAAPEPLEQPEMRQLAGLLVRHLSRTLDPNWLAAYTGAVRKGKALEVTRALEVGERLPVAADSPAFFLEAKPARFEFGATVRWMALSDELPELCDFGVVVGRFFGYAPERSRWLWCYLLLLDSDSPNARWCTVETFWEEDLERYE